MFLFVLVVYRLDVRSSERIRLLPTLGGGEPRHYPFLVVEPLRIREVAIERVEVEAERFCRIFVIELVDLHDAYVFDNLFAAEHFAVPADMAEAGFALGYLGHDGRILEIFAHILLESKRLVRKHLLLRPRGGRRNGFRRSRSLAIKPAEEEKHTRIKLKDAG